MQSSPYNPIELLLEERVLSLFALPSGNVIWQGGSELNTQSRVYYFYINETNYFLVNEVHHGVGENTFVNSLIGNAVAPHQRVAPILPKEGARTYVNVTRDNSESASKLLGDFSLFRILD